MTVAELIDELKRFPADAEVIIGKSGSAHYTRIGSVGVLGQVVLTRRPRLIVDLPKCDVRKLADSIGAK